ncbi:hypothetical protein [Actinacidiphila glaucinigra]|uniref:hypothetical protein n=1 Tax=Actinacidiphila glaucinigra TaxID=235986 RepID=UPI0035D74F9A
MPEREEPPPPTDEGPTLVNMTRLAAELGVSRQALHDWRREHADFPAAQRRAGSTRDQWDLDEVRRYWENRDLKPGRRTDLEDEDTE